MIKDFLSYNLVEIILTDIRFHRFWSISNIKTGFEVPYLAHFYVQLSEGCRDDVCVSQVNQILMHKHPLKKTTILEIAHPDLKSGCVFSVIHKHVCLSYGCVTRQQEN